MKAQDFADIYRRTESEGGDAIAAVVLAFRNDTIEVIKKRRTSSYTGLQAVLREESDKWKSFCRKIDGTLREDGFAVIVDEMLPMLAGMLGPKPAPLVQPVSRRGSL